MPQRPGPHPDTTRPGRWLVALLALALLAGCTQAPGEEPGPSERTELLPMTLAQLLYPTGASAATAEPAGVARLSIGPLQPGDNAVSLHVNGLDGAALALDPAAVELTARALAPEAVATPVPLASEDAAWSATVALPDPAWYALEATVALPDGPATTTFYLHLPDPSVYGAAAIDLPASDPDAEALYEAALDRYGSWRTGSWRESLTSGADALVVTDYAAGEQASGLTAMSARSRFAAAFRARADGTPPDPPRLDFSERIAVGETSWTRGEDGAWVESRALGVSGFPERAAIYTGAEGVQLAGTETVGGIDTQIITFYLPQKGGQAEAWFAWWIDPETGDPLRMVMVAQMHYMIWEFHGIDTPTPIAPPVRSGATPAATPRP